MATALPHPELVSQSSGRTRSYNTNSSRTGDRYSQRMADGLNNAADKWNVVWENVNNTEYQTIVAVLDSVGGWDILTWTPPNESIEKKWTIDGDTSYRAKSGDIWDISTTLRQEFDI